MANKTITIDGTDFYLSKGGDYVGECGTSLRWNPLESDGYIRHSPDGWVYHSVSITSFGNFGDDMHVARELADRWCEKARKAWNKLMGE